MRRYRLPLIILAFIAFIFVYPRLLLSWMEPNDPLLNYLYQYGFGLIVFGIGLWVVIGAGALKPGRGRDTFWLKVLVGGFVGYALVHGLWILAAVNVPFLGRS